ncbi:MAG: hypothetical protein AB1604_09815, partial [Euryarchaeota archaeon]
TRANQKEIQNHNRNTHISTLQNEKLDTKTHNKITTPTNFTTPGYGNLFIFSKDFYRIEESGII